MCGRFYVDAFMEKEIWGVVRELTRKEMVPTAGEVKPSDSSLIIKGSRHALNVEAMSWGFRQFSGSGLIINARAESVIDNMMPLSFKFEGDDGSMIFVNNLKVNYCEDKNYSGIPSK